MNNQYMINSFITMFILVIGVCVIVIIFQWCRNHSKPKIITNATILDKHIQKISKRRKSADGLFHERSSYRYWILFEIEGGEKLEFLVNKLDLNCNNKLDTHAASI